jgi:hypothetical protein
MFGLFLNTPGMFQLSCTVVHKQQNISTFHTNGGIQDPSKLHEYAYGHPRFFFVVFQIFKIHGFSYFPVMIRMNTT